MVVGGGDDGNDERRLLPINGVVGGYWILWIWISEWLVMVMVDIDSGCVDERCVVSTTVGYVGINISKIGYLVQSGKTKPQLRRYDNISLYNIPMGPSRATTCSDL
jgi:hypothetical protein